MTVEQLLTMSSREFVEWKAFLEIERSGGLSQEAVDLDAKVKSVWANLSFGG